MATKTYRECVRNIKTFTNKSLKHSEHFSCLPDLGFILTLLPVLIYGCTPSHQYRPPQFSPIKINITDAKATSVLPMTLDFLVFNDDRDARIDAYQRNIEPTSDLVEVSSRSGAKLIYVIGNLQKEMFTWAEISSARAAESLCASLEDERMAYPVMSGKGKNGSPEEGITDITLTPLASEVILRSLRCDFKGKPYEDSTLEDIRIYLTNVNAECPIWAEGIVMPKRIINTGGYCETDMEDFREKELIMQELSSPVGDKKIRTDVCLRCFPSNSLTSSPGTPFTCLVIEGRIDGETWYWPIEVNRESGKSDHTGIGRNLRYIHDVVITCKGSQSADIPVKRNEIEINASVSEWNEMDEYSVRF